MTKDLQKRDMTAHTHAHTGSNKREIKLSKQTHVNKLALFYQLNHCAFSGLAVSRANNKNLQKHVYTSQNYFHPFKYMQNITENKTKVVTYL